MAPIHDNAVVVILLHYFLGVIEMTKSSTLINAKDLAKTLSVSERHVWRLKASGELPKGQPPDVCKENGFCCYRAAVSRPQVSPKAQTGPGNQPGKTGPALL